MATEKFSAATDRSTILTTELNALANGDTSAAGTEVDNSTNKDRYALAVLVVTYGTAPTVKSTCQMYALIAPDGTNYEQGGAGVVGGTGINPPEAGLVATFQVHNTTSAQRIASPVFRLRGPYKHKFVLKNRTGQAFPASGTTVNLYTFNRDIN